MNTHTNLSRADFISAGTFSFEQKEIECCIYEANFDQWYEYSESFVIDPHSLYGIMRSYKIFSIRIIFDGQKLLFVFNFGNRIVTEDGRYFTIFKRDFEIFQNQYTKFQPYEEYLSYFQQSKLSFSKSKINWQKEGF
jgi:hypothetical protein